MRAGLSLFSSSRGPHRGQPSWWAASALVGFLLAAGVVLRIYFRHIPNFSPVAAIALYAGFRFPGVWRAALIPLGVMVLSDTVIGGYEPRLMLTVYTMLALPAVAGGLVLRRDMRWSTRFAAVFGLSLLASVSFFIVSNSAVWAFSPWYAKTAGGWIRCLSAGVPFFRYTVGGDLGFATALFGGHCAWVWARQRSRAAQLADVR